MFIAIFIYNPTSEVNLFVSDFIYLNIKSNFSDIIVFKLFTCNNITSHLKIALRSNTSL